MKVSTENKDNNPTSSRVEEWRKPAPDNNNLGWPRYQGEDVPLTEEDREKVRTAFLDAAWELKQRLLGFPRHLNYTSEQFSIGFVPERQGQWIPLIEGLIQVLHLWRRLYPGIDVTRRLNYQNLVELKVELDTSLNLTPQTFERKLFTAAGGFRTSFDYCRGVNDKEVVEKFKLLSDTFFTVSSHYSGDIESMEKRESQPCHALPAISPSY